MAKIPGMSGGGDDSTETALADFLDPKADSLLAKADFAGMIERFAKSTVLAAFTGATGIVLAIQRNLVEFTDAIMNGYLRVYTAIATSAGHVYALVFQNAQADLAQFGFLATPIGVLIVLSVLAVFTFVLDIFLGGDD